MQTMLDKLLISFVLTLGFCVSVSAQISPPPTNRLETGGNYQIRPPPANMMFQITDNPTNSGDDNLVWSHSGRMLAIDRTDPSVQGPNKKYIYILDVRNLGHIQEIGARSSAMSNAVFPNITDFTWNDDRVLFGWVPVGPGDPPTFGKCVLMSCTPTGAVSVVPFLQSDPQGGNPTNNVFSPSVVYDQTAGKERLLCLVSTGPEPFDPDPATRVNLFTVTYDHGGVPNWNDRVQLTRFNSNLPINSVKWCPELGTNYQPICNRIEMMVTYGGSALTNENNQIIVFNSVQEVIADPAKAPTSLDDPHLVVVETNLLANSQVSWTFDGQYLMYGRMGTNTPPAPPAFDIYSKLSSSPTNPAVKFEVPSSISGEQQQWLAISPDGMKAAFTVDHKAYVIPLQFDNVAVTGAVVTNILTDGSYTTVHLPGGAIPSNTTFSIVAPPSVDTNNFIGEFSGYAREFSFSGVSNAFNLLTNAQITIPGSLVTPPTLDLEIDVYVYNPQGNAGQTGTWDRLDSQVTPENILCAVPHFSIYAIGFTSAAGTPTNVIASKGTHINVVCVDWDAVPNATSYQVWRNTTDATNSATKFDTEPTAASYDDTNVTSGVVYYYWVKAKNSAGVSDFSSSACGYAMGAALAADFDGDRLADPAVYNTNGNWKIKLSSGGYSLLPLTGFLGGHEYTALAADFDGDRLADPAVYNAESELWAIKLSTLNYLAPTVITSFGGSGWEALAGDFDGDRLADPAIYQATTGDWKIRLSTAGYATITKPALLAMTGYDWTPIATDFDGDGKVDPAIYKASTGSWIVMLSRSDYGIAVLEAGFLGSTGYVGMAADFDGDGYADPAVAQNSTGNWKIKLSGGNYSLLELNSFLGGQ